MNRETKKEIYDSVMQEMAKTVECSLWNLTVDKKILM